MFMHSQHRLECTILVRVLSLSMLIVAVSEIPIGHGMAVIGGRIRPLPDYTLPCDHGPHQY